MESDNIVVFRKDNVSEFFGALIFKTCRGYEIAGTDNISEPNEKLNNTIANRNVLFVGGYYTGHLSELKNNCNALKVFYNYYETPDEEDHLYDLAEEYRGFSTYAVKTNASRLENVEEGSYLLFLKISNLIDEYIYGFPSEESINFNAGVHSLSSEISNIEKVALVSNKKISIDETIRRGKETRSYNEPVVKERIKSSKQTCLLDKYNVNVCLGDDNIGDTCIALAEKTGIGIIINYNSEQKITVIFCRVTKESGYNASEIMKEYSPSGCGTRSLGYCVMDGLSDLYKLFY